MECGWQRPREGGWTRAVARSYFATRRRGDRREFSGKNFAFSHDSRLLAISGGNAETVQLWDLHARQFLPAIPQHVTGQGKPLAFSPDGNLAVSDGETLQLWNPYERKVVAKYRASKPSLEFTPRTLMYIGFAPNGQTLATTDVRGDVALLDAKTLRLLQHVPEALEMWGHKAAFSRRRRLLGHP